MNTTPSQTVGPYYGIGLSRGPQDELALDGVELHGQLFDGRGEPIPDGMIEVWDASGHRWGRSGTDGEGRFRFLVPRECDVLETYVFARGILRHERTRIYLREVEDGVLASLTPEERATLLAVPDGDGLRLDIRMQGDHATVFFSQ